MQVVHKDHIFEALSFDEFVAYGKRVVPETQWVNGMPWSFSWKDYPVTHETDEFYIISTLECDIHFRQGQVLLLKDRQVTKIVSQELLDTAFQEHREADKQPSADSTNIWSEQDVREKLAEFNRSKPLLPHNAAANLQAELITEVARALEQANRYRETGISTAGHGGSYDTCFEAILNKYFHILSPETSEQIFTSMSVMLSFAEAMVTIKRLAQTETKKFLLYSERTEK